MSNAAPSDATARVNALNLHYIDWGGDAAVPAVALHGFALNCHSWDEVAPALSDRLHWHALDQRGHGISDRAPELAEYYRDHMADDVRGFIESTGLDRPGRRRPQHGRHERDDLRQPTPRRPARARAR